LGSNGKNVIFFGGLFGGLGSAMVRRREGGSGMRFGVVSVLGGANHDSIMQAGMSKMVGVGLLDGGCAGCWRFVCSELRGIEILLRLV